MKNTVQRDDLKLVSDAQHLLKVETDENTQQIKFLTKKAEDHHQKILKLNEFPTPEEFALVRNRVDGCENENQKVKKNIGELEKKLKQLKLSQKDGPDE